ncbi:homoserine dehydrogenase [Ktedonobacteria bacterium brp13]|nr:homoserine dehydrogenase [Ktedonobacteria bacterium brp13]
MKRLRVSLIGFGVVGQGLAALLHTKRALLQQTYGLDLVLVSVANSRHGFIYHEEGLDIPLLLSMAAQRQPLTQHPGVQHWAEPMAGLRATGRAGDVLAEATGTNLRDAEPGLSHIRAALTQGMHVVTANKGPAALAAGELFDLAQQHHVQLRLESTVMAGTPVISTIREGMAGAGIHTVRGILNGTTNYILSAMTQGRDYAEVLAEAQAQGYAEADPTADVEGYDVVAKTLILSALIFNYPLTLEDVVRQGISGVTREQVQQAVREEKRIKLVATLSLDPQHREAKPIARVEPLALPLTDPLARIDGVMNAITVHSDVLDAVTISGPGAGGLQTGQGLLADIIALAR